MRIAVVTTSYPSHDGDPSGHFVETEVRELQRAGNDVHVVRPDAGGAFGWPGVAARVKERPFRALEAGAWIARATMELRRARPERIIAHWAVPCAYPIAFKSDAALEIVSHGGDVRLMSKLPGRAALVEKLIARSSRWRFVSEELRETLAAALPPDVGAALRAASEIVPSALDIPDVMADAQANRAAVGGRRLYVCAGRLVASKRVDKVIDYVASSMKSDRTLIVLGDGPERAHLERLAAAWRADVRFLGKTSRREALGWIGAADELVHASRAEGLSTVIREAERLGVPVTILS